MSFLASLSASSSPYVSGEFLALPVHTSYLILAGGIIFAFVLLITYVGVRKINSTKVPSSDTAFVAFCRFFYASFLKPHEKDDGLTGQQGALESFYKQQV